MGGTAGRAGSSGRPAAGRSSLLALRDPFSRFLAGATLSQYGDWLTTVALLVVVVRVTGSTAAPAGYLLARILPRLVGAGPGGSLADRYGGARVVAACSVLQGALTAAIIPAEHAGSAAGIYAAVVVAQLVSGFSRSALGTVIPTVVRQEELGRANALFGITTASSQVVGPALGAPLFLLRGPDLLIAIDAGTFFLAAVLMLLLPGRFSVRVAVPGALPGFPLVAADPDLRALAAAYFTDAMTITVTSASLVLAANERFGGESVVAFLFASVGIGDAIGGALMLRRAPPTPTRVPTVLAAVASIVVLAAISAVHEVGLAVILLVVSGACSTAYITWGATDMQRRVDSGFLGRVNAAVVLAQSLGMVAGAIIAVILIPLIHWDRALFIGGCIGIALLAGLTLSGPRRTSQHGPIEPAASWRLRR